MTPTANIIHFIPNNNTPCGGIKVHYQLAHLAQELGCNVQIAFPKPEYPTWMLPIASSLPPITVTDINDASLRGLDPENTLVIGWEDIGQLVRTFPEYRKVAYIQGEALFDRSQSTEGVRLWFSSIWNMQCISTGGILVPVPLDTRVFNINGWSAAKFAGKRTLLVLARKGGRQRFQQAWDLVPADVRNQLEIVFFDDADEQTFATTLRDVAGVVCTAYPEGFNLIPLEAMACGTIAIGFAGGGGLEYMRHAVNSYLAPDADYLELAKGITWFAKLDESLIPSILHEGFQTVRKHSMERTKLLLAGAIEKSLNTLVSR